MGGRGPSVVCPFPSAGFPPPTAHQRYFRALWLQVESCNEEITSPLTEAVLFSTVATVAI